MTFNVKFISFMFALFVVFSCSLRDRHWHRVDRSKIKTIKANRHLRRKLEKQLVLKK